MDARRSLRPRRNQQLPKLHHPSYWYATIVRLYESIGSLKQFPNLGRPGREAGTRELVFAPLPYVAVYRVREEVVEVLRILHSARDI